MTSIDERNTFRSLLSYGDLREWLERADELGELKKVDGASWEADIGNVTEMLHHTYPAPAVLFDNVPGCEPGFRVAVNTLGSNEKIAMTMGLPAGLSKVELSRGINGRLNRNSLIPMKVVEGGSVMENVDEGGDIDLYKFPTPIWHEGDEGTRYIGTAGYVVTRDPDNHDWVNIGTYRVMIHGKDRLGSYISPGKHGFIHREKYFERGEPCPVAMVFGGDPLSFLMSSTELPQGVSEYDYIGGLRGEPFEVIQGPVTGLPFPASAEIVVEGYLNPDPDSYELEGPFGEWAGYYASSPRPEPVVDVKAVYYRNDPIILGSPPNRPPDELARFRAFIRSALLEEEIRKAGVPDITAAWAHEAGGARMLLGIAIKQRYPGHAAQAGHVAATCRVGAYAGRYIVVVDDDVDVSDLEELTWAMCTRSDPAESIDFIKNAWSSVIDPRVSPGKKESGDLVISRAVIDATRPYHWRDEFPKVNAPSRETMDKTREDWGYLLK